MRITAIAAASGLLFGAGLALSGMVDPLKVLGFLDVTGDWDPTLAFVMGGALAVTLPGFALASRLDQPLFDTRFHVSSLRDIDKRLLAGAALFGVGWGAVGYCPGPSLAGLAVMWRELALFIPAMFAGAWAAWRLPVAGSP